MNGLFFLTQVVLVVLKAAAVLDVSWWIIMLPTIVAMVCVALYLAAVTYFVKKVYG